MPSFFSLFPHIRAGKTLVLLSTITSPNFEIINQLVRVFVLYFAGILVNYHHPAIVSVHGWFLRNEFLWKVVREV